MAIHDLLRGELGPQQKTGVCHGDPEVTEKTRETRSRLLLALRVPVAGVFFRVGTNRLPLFSKFLVVDRFLEAYPTDLAAPEFAKEHLGGPVQINLSACD